MNFKILPSLLSANLMALGDEINAVVKAGADMIHFDVMDNHYVPNLTLGPFVCKQLHQQFNNIPIDVHLMTTPVDDLIVAFAEAGASRISIHPDATTHIDRSLQLINSKGCSAGIALNPGESIDCHKWSHHHLEFVLVMTVNPGFAGQILIKQVLPKIKQIHEQYPHLAITVDGGITPDNIAELAKLGASQFVAGSSIFNSPNYKHTIDKMKQLLVTQVGS